MDPDPETRAERVTPRAVSGSGRRCDRRFPERFFSSSEPSSRKLPS